MLDDRLSALWQADVAKARERTFELAVMRKMERARFRSAVVAIVAGLAAVTLLLALAVPMLTSLWQQTFAPFLNGPVVAAVLAVAIQIAVQSIHRRNTH